MSGGSASFNPKESVLAVDLNIPILLNNRLMFLIDILKLAICFSRQQ